VFVDIVFLSAAADIFSLSLSLSRMKLENVFCAAAAAALTPKCASLFTNAKKAKVFLERKRTEKSSSSATTSSSSSSVTKVFRGVQQEQCKA
jgi:hypothetical protein